MWVSRKKFEELQKAVDNLNRQLEYFTNRPQLENIERDGMKLIFKIWDNGCLYNIKAIPVVDGGKE